MSELVVCGCPLSREDEIEDVECWEGVVGLWGVRIYRFRIAGLDQEICEAHAVDGRRIIHIGHTEMDGLVDSLRERIWEYMRGDARAVQLPEVMLAEERQG